MDRCPECGGALVWDEKSGFVVCGSCGLVVDRVFDYAGPAQSPEEIERQGRRGRPRRAVVDRAGYRLRLKLYSKVAKISSERPWLVVDADKVLKTGRFLYSLKSKASIEAEKNIEERGLWDMVKLGLSIIEKKNPALLARSLRGRYALAYMLAYAGLHGKMPPEEEVVEVFNISGTSYKRLASIARGIV